MPRNFPLLPLIAALALSACERRPDEGPVVVSAIGGPARLAPPDDGRLDMAQAMLLSATAQGLVRLDAAGQVEPALAERWIVIDDGATYIFRLSSARWADGSPVTAGDVVTALRRATAAGSGNPLQPQLAAIRSIVAMTPQVIEIQLDGPRPDLLALLARPELAIYRQRTMEGSGPFRIVERAGGWVTLRPDRDPQAAGQDDAEPPTPEEHVRLRGERAGIAIARFARRQSDYVAGGTWRDWPLVAQASVAPANIRREQADGLFGLAITGRDGFLAERDNRAALAMAIDRAQLTGAFASEWPATETILPAMLDSATEPVVAAWAQVPASDRAATARAIAAIWRARSIERAGDPVPAIRIALPDAPGANLLFGAVRAASERIGVPVRRVSAREAADLVVVDRTAPHDSGLWYLEAACRRCDGAARALIAEARATRDPAQRGVLIARAEAAIADEVAFIPIARPLRWSLVALRLDAWQANRRGWHPLNHLRAVPN